MSNFQYILKSRNKALAVFQKVHRQLQEVINSLSAESKAAQERVHRYEVDIEKEKELINEAEKELRQTINTQQKIEALIN